MINLRGLDDFTIGYLECAIWADAHEYRDEELAPADYDYSIDEIAETALEEMVKDCDDFQSTYAELLEAAYKGSNWYNKENAGHDFWLTRNGHGAGFWDRGLGETGKALSDAARACGGRILIANSETGLLEIFSA